MKLPKTNSQDKKKWKLPEGEFLSSGPLYELLALYMPLSVLAAFLFLFAALLPFPIPIATALISGALAGLAASTYYDLIRDMFTNHTVAHIRGGVIVVILAYALASLASGSPSFAERFIPSLSNLLSALAALYVWYMVVFLKDIFRGQKRFESYIEAHKGEALKQKLAENGDIINISALGRIQNVYIGQFAVLWFAAIIGAGVKGALPLPLTVFLFAITAATACIFGFFAMTKQAYYFAGDGMDIPARLRHKRLFMVAVFAVAAAILAALLASDRSILPLSLFTSLFALLASLFRPRNVAPRPIDTAEPLFEPPPSLPNALIEDTEPIAPWDGWKYVRYAFIGLVAAAFLWFLIKPLIERDVSHSRLSTRLRSLFASWLRGIKRALLAVASLFTVREKAMRTRKNRQEDVSRVSEEVMEIYATAKKKGMRKNVSLFARLIIWGAEELDVVWKPSHAPGEFCRLLADAVLRAPSSEEAAVSEHVSPDDTVKNAAAVTRCGELFERALYAESPFTESEQAEFEDMVMRLTAEEED